MADAMQKQLTIMLTGNADPRARKNGAAPGRLNFHPEGLICQSEYAENPGTAAPSRGLD